MKTIFKLTTVLLSAAFILSSCGNNNGKASGSNGALNSSNAEKVYVAPGEHDEFYAFYMFPSICGC